jgi:S1-C subfamily serine protease
VPLEGPRTRRPTSFDIEGRNDEIVSTTWVELLGDEIKGFTLVWPAGDEQRRTRVLDEMRKGFARLPGTLPVAVQPDTPAARLLAGLEVRRPDRDRSGFYVDGAGAVLTTHEAVRTCGRVTFDDGIEAEVAAADEGLGLALLRPRARLSPIRFARFRAAPPQLRSEVAVAGYPFGGILPAPSLNYGRLEEARGLDGDTSLNRLVLASEPGETGGPVFDQQGAVLGILQPPDGGSRQLPDGVAVAPATGSIADFLTAAGLSPEPSNGGAEVPPEELTRLAADMTVLVGCWN